MCKSLPPFYSEECLSDLILSFISFPTYRLDLIHSFISSLPPFSPYRLDHSACGCVDEAAQETGVSLHLLVGVVTC